MGQSSKARPDDVPAAPRLPVVALGASAGGLEALRQLFGSLPTDTGMAYVVVQHLDPERPSMLVDVLAGATPLPVVEVKDAMRVAPNRVHVIPSGTDLKIRRGHLMLVPRRKTGVLHLPIDTFFRSLAEDESVRAIGVVLSGSGSDGTDGLRAIKALDGIAMAQEPGSAQFDSMPRSAISAGVVDFCGSPTQIAGEIGRIARHPYLAPIPTDSRETSDDEESLDAIFTALRQASGSDFHEYKRTTIRRRIERRMTLRNVRTLGDYARILETDRGEIQALATDLLIHVTSFFRDPESFAALERGPLSALARRKAPGSSIRVWVPGCSTGEEAYSIVMCLLDVLGARADTVNIQVFGTDASASAIDVARLGVYPEASLNDVVPERRSRYFHRVDRGFQIAKRVRDPCIFVQHDITRDPPFAKLDLISCRNVLIYFDAELQRRVMPTLHYCLNEGGHLFLGQSETITGFRDLFAPVDKEHRIFVKSGDGRRRALFLPASREVETRLAENRYSERRSPAREAQRQADHLLLARYAPPGVLVNERLEIVQFRGRTGKFLEPPPGQPQANLLRMVREELVAHVHDATERAKSRGIAIRIDGLRTKADGTAVSVEVVPLATIPDSTERYFLVLFDEGSEPAERLASPEPSDHGTELERLRAELITTKDYLQSLISDHQLVTDDLAATNEEMVAANEELQSTNEELQSAKEELQSTNEELSTVNDQLRNRNRELDQIAADLVNVLSSIEIPVIIVDLELRVRRFTPTASPIAKFIPEDVGRSIEDLRLRIDVPDLADRIRSVIDRMQPGEWEVRGLDGHWFRLQIRPYRATDNRLDGAVLSFVDVDVLKKAYEEVEEARDYAQAIVETVTTALVVLDDEMRVLSANGSFFEMFGLSPEAALGKHLLALRDGMWDLPDVRWALEEALARQLPFTALEVNPRGDRARERTYSLTGRSIAWGGKGQMVLLALDDVTDLRALETERVQLLRSEKQARLDAERATRAKDVFLAVLSHELRTPLSTILMSAELLKKSSEGGSKAERASAAIERAANMQARLIDDLLDVSRIVSGKLLLSMGPVALEGVVREAVDTSRSSALAKGLTLDLDVEGDVGVVYGDAGRLGQVVTNLLTNAIKFTPPGGRIRCRLARGDDTVEILVSDTGMGIRPEVLPHLFARFVQADSSVTRTHGGLGLGLAIVRHIIELHGGRVDAESPGEGQGSTFRVTLPAGTAQVDDGKAREGTIASLDAVRVLLVDDDDDTRESYALILAHLGAEVRAVGSVAEALAEIQAFKPQVLLSDVAMPGEDGYALLRKVRELGPDHGGTVPAAAITALASDEDRRRAIDAGFQLHVAKPMDAGRLASVVRTLADWPPDRG